MFSINGKYLAPVQEKFYTNLSAFLSRFRLGRLFKNGFRKIDLYKVLKADDRISSLDVFRALAIFTVVLYHFHHFLPFGLLGVDLFFVISGLLVGGILTKEFTRTDRINVPKFLLQRGFKIWPSYYFFLIFGSFLAFVFYRHSHPSHIIPSEDLAKYLFFFQNYDEMPVHWSFDHVWSLCVEEHFYIFLSTSFIIIQLLTKPKNRMKVLYGFIFFTIAFGIFAKYYAYFYTIKKDTYIGTHNRIDALAWGVLLNIVLLKYGDRLKKIKNLPILSMIGVLIFGLLILIARNTTDNEVYVNIIMRSIIPVCFFLTILGVYYQDFSKFYFLRTLGYYSYNWYLWHPIFVVVITEFISSGKIGLTFYVMASLSMAILATTFIEEPFLRMRKKVISKIFKKN
jgi:peptidoglycan/LPS O-acetylase OafA/YrhL